MYKSIVNKEKLSRDLWIEVDLSAIAHNMRVVRRLSHSALVSAVVKADGYGHGAVAVGRTLIENGADRFCVATADEAYELREAFPETPILILSEVDVHLAPDLARRHIAVTVTSAKKLIAFSKALRSAVESGAFRSAPPCLHVHIKVDTGMGRLGCRPTEESVDEWMEALREIRKSGAVSTRISHTGGVGFQSEPSSGIDAARAANALIQKGAASQTNAANQTNAAGLTDSAGELGIYEINIEGLFSHFAKADDADKTFSHLQAKRFMNFAEMLARRGINPPIRHMANSAAIAELPGYHFDMVRAGILMFGMTPSGEPLERCLERRCCDPISTVETRGTDDPKTNSRRDAHPRTGSQGEHIPHGGDCPPVLKPALAIKSRAIFVKRIPEDMGIGYSHAYTAEANDIVVTIPAGYADGISRLLSNRMDVLIGGRRCRQIGNICMDHLMVLGYEGIEVGDEVVIAGCQEIKVRSAPEEYRKAAGSEEKEACIPIEEMASKMGTLNYEIVCMLSKRIPRVYLDGSSEEAGKFAGE